MTEKPTSMRIPEEVKELAKRAAKKTHRSVNAYYVHAIEKGAKADLGIKI